MDKIKEPGYVYILTNPSFREDWIKIGKSARPVDIRSKELDNTAVPLPFEIYATMKTSKYNEVEKLVHKIIDNLTNFRIRQNREFFNVAPQKALEIFKEIALTIDDAEVVVLEDNNSASIANEIISHTYQSTSPKGKREKFSINGKGAFCKNGCALEVVKQYVAKNNLTYKRIESLFCSEIPHLLKPVNEIISKQQESFDKKPNSRWHFKSLLKSADGIDFLVTTQIGDNCPIDFKDVVTLAASLGYNIEKID